MNETGTSFRETPRLLLFTGSAVLLLGLLILFGWHTRAPRLLQINPEYAPMQYNAALCFALCGAGFLALAWRNWKWTLGLAAAAGAIGFLTLLEYLFSINLGIDELIMDSYILVKTSHPGRMAPNTALSFTLVSVSLMLLGWKFHSHVAHRLAGFLGLSVFMLGFLALYGYVTGITSTYGWGELTRMAMNTAMGFILLGLGLVPHLRPAGAVAGRLEGRELRNSILLYAVGSALSIALLSASLAVIVMYERLQEAELKDLRQALNAKRLAIEQFIARSRKIAQQIANRTTARQLLQSYNAGELSKSHYEAATAVIFGDAMRASPEIAGITRFSPDGRPLISVGKPIPEGLWPRAAFSTNSVAIRGPLPLDCALKIVTAAPVGLDGPRREGTDIVMLMFPDAVALLRGQTGLGIPSTLLLGVQEDEGIGYYSVGATGLQKNAQPLSGDAVLAIERALAGAAGTSLPEVSPGAEPVVVGYSPAGDAALAIEVNRHEFYADADRQMGILAANIFILVCLGGTGAWWLVRPLAAAIVIKTGELRREIQDKTRMLEAELENRRRAEQEARLLNMDLKTLLHVISHDLREPLRAIENFSHLVRERYAPKLDEKGQDFLFRVERAARRLDSQLETILILSRAQRMDEPTEFTDSRAIVEEALARLEGRVRETRSQIRVADHLPRLRVDRRWAVEALYNLLDNALKFVREGESPDIEIAPFNDEGQPGLVVRDRGPGIPAKEAENIFQLFYRGNSDNHTTGTGAGLAISRMIAERHGGRVQFRSREGGGSEFIITFRNPGQPRPPTKEDHEKS